MTTIREAERAWCVVDDCPSYICNGPHIAHVCSDGARVDQRFDNPEPCPFGCGWEPCLTGASRGTDE